MPSKDQLIAAHRGIYLPLPDSYRLPEDERQGKVTPNPELKVRLNHGPRGYYVSIRPVVRERSISGMESELYPLMDERGAYSWTIDERRFSAKSFAEHLAFIEANKEHILRLLLAKDGEGLFNGFKRGYFPPAPIEQPEQPELVAA